MLASNSPWKYSHFEQELEAFESLSRLNEHENVCVQCYGSFSHVDSSGALAYNLLLELGDSDLRTFWMRNMPPIAYTEVTASITSFFQIWSKLDVFHEALPVDEALSDDGDLPGDEAFPAARSSSSVETWRHGDIKSENILCLGRSDGSWTFKLTDLGRAQRGYNRRRSVSQFRTKMYGELSTSPAATETSLPFRRTARAFQIWTRFDSVRRTVDRLHDARVHSLVALWS